MRIDDKDRVLLARLSSNGRESVSELARNLNLSRSTVKDRIAKLEKQGIITGYTILFSEQYLEKQIQAHVMISSDPKHAPHITRQLRKITDVKTLHTVNGNYDMLAIVNAESTFSLDKTLDKIGGIEGIEKTVSSIILSTKF